MLVTVWHCDRCGLDFVRDDPPKTCPACRNHYSGQVTIRLAGQNIEVESVKLYGENPLKKAAVTEGLDSLRLGIRCPHGFLADYICNECS